jgi:hypothetical protein
MVLVRTQQEATAVEIEIAWSRGKRSSTSRTCSSTRILLKTQDTAAAVSAVAGHH